jgi:hypothetical protein
MQTSELNEMGLEEINSQDQNEIEGGCCCCRSPYSLF